jgi:hypothetical protein
LEHSICGSFKVFTLHLRIRLSIRWLILDDFHLSVLIHPWKSENSLAIVLQNVELMGGESKFPHTDDPCDPPSFCRFPNLLDKRFRIQTQQEYPHCMY